MQKRVGIINTDAGNVKSVIYAFTKLGCIASILDEPTDEIDVLVIPGQGRFGKVMQALRKRQLDHYIRQWYFSKKPIIAICVGMQIFFQDSDEDPDIPGLGIFPDSVTKLDTPKQPVIGWLPLNSKTNLLSDKVVYFVNGYGVKATQFATAHVNYQETFTAAIESRGLRAFQFHPEKSGKDGLEVLAKCL